MKTAPCLLISVFCLLFLAPPAPAWDNPGHMAVAGLAYDELTAAQQQRLATLIRKHPAFSLIQDGFPDGDPDDREVTMAAATWPDLAKRAHSGFVDNGQEENDPPVTKVELDHKMHRGYHFIDTPLFVGNGPPPASLPAVPRVNAVGVVNVLVAQLHSNEDDPAKAYDLGWLLHLTGDLHQPLHAVTGVTELFPEGDHGGNFVHVKGAIPGITEGAGELHKFWDDILGKTAPADKITKHPRLDEDATTADEIIASVKTLSLGAHSVATNVNPSVWATESFKMAKRDTYNLELDVVPGDRGDELHATLDEHYRQTAIKDARKRIRLAGHRLALLLKGIL